MILIPFCPGANLVLKIPAGSSINPEPFVKIKPAESTPRLIEKGAKAQGMKMAEYQGTTGPHESWEETYRKTPPLDLPWNSGMVDGDLRDLLEKDSLPSGKAYDLGCGPGNDAAFLAKEGWEVTAVDIAPSALDLARATARKAGVEGKIKFLLADVLKLHPSGNAQLVHDRGCFHTLPSVFWEEYRRTVAGLLSEGGTLALKVFSFKMPAGFGPYRFTPGEIQKVFGGDFELKEVKEGIFHGPRKPFSLFCVLAKSRAKG
jgi:SAM-dependent methyltransferase